METPKKVIQEAGELVEMYGDKFAYLGKWKDGRDVFVFEMPENEKTGFPFVYLYDKNELVMEVTGFDALDIIASFEE